MDLFQEKIDLAGLGLDHRPLALSGTLEIDPPTLRDNTGWADRIGRAAARRWGLKDVRTPLSLAPEALKLAGKDRLWAGVGLEDENWRLSGLDDSGPATTYGLAVDVGSTTLVFALVDLERPAVVDQLTLANPQIEIGADILTRAHFADKTPGHSRLVALLRRGINQGLDLITAQNNLKKEHVAAAVFSGNTAMTHYLLDLPVRTLIREPYVPVLNRPWNVRAVDLDLDILGQAPVLIMPNKGSYFGGDLMAGLVVTGMARSEALCLMVDVGTNAEVVLGQKDWLVGAAGAAGPALEGGVAAMGMVAGPGAIDRVRIDRETREISWRTIGNQPPKGICGSGLIDLFAELFLSGLIDFRGKITLPPGDPRRVETDEGPGIVVALGKETDNGSPIILTEIELDILTRSKAGMYTILSTVLISVGLEFDEIQHFFVAGTFGQYIDPRMAVAVGMVPDIPLERFVPLGNSSLKGAILAMLSGKARREVMDVWHKLTYLEMNVNQDLMNRFSAARFIPHTEARLFPSVGTTIV